MASFTADAPPSPISMVPFQLHTPSSAKGAQRQPICHSDATPSQSVDQSPDMLGVSMRQNIEYHQTAFQPAIFQSPFQQEIPYPAQLYPYTDIPVSAPPVFHGRILWDHDVQSPGFEHGLMSQNMSHLGPDSTLDQMRTWSDQNLHQNGAAGSFVQDGSVMPHALGASGFWSCDNIETQLHNQSFRSKPCLTPAAAVVNPSLVFSFASPVKTINPSTMAASSLINMEARQPYEQQFRESSREKEWTKRTRKQQQKDQTNRAPSTWRSASRAQLQQSNTDAGSRRNNVRSFDGRHTSQAAEAIPRHDSPLLNKSSHVSLSSLPETNTRPRVRTRLVIDANGTARTETSTDTDHGYSQRRGRKWPEDDSSEVELLLSSQSSASIPSSDHLRPPKHGRVDSDDDSLGLSKRSPSSSSLQSLTTHTDAAISVRSGLGKTHRRASQQSFSSSSAHQEIESFAQIIRHVHGDTGSGDAQDALKKLVGGRWCQGQIFMREWDKSSKVDIYPKDHCDPDATIKPRRRVKYPERLNLMDITRFPTTSSSPPLPSAQPGSSTNTPTTDRSNRSIDSTRCVCGVSDNHINSPLINCDNCGHSAHVRCVFGKRATEMSVKLPQAYVCSFCTGVGEQSISCPDITLYSGDDPARFGASPLRYKRNPLMS